MAARRDMGEGTRAVHAGLPESSAGAPFLPGPVLAAPYHLPGDPHATPYGYGRYANPTWTAYEAAVGELEGGLAVAFASGMAACTAVLVPGLAPGDLLVACSDGYPVVRALAAEHLEPRGVEVRFVPTAEIGRALEGAAMVWLETPSNPALDVCDVAAIALVTEAPVVVDNTLATPLGQRPLELGADMSVSSGSKALSGHGDLVMGLVTCADPERAAAVRRWRDRTGAIPGPFEAWLAHRSLATLELRLDRQCATALALAELLAAREDVDGVRYPGLAASPGHELASRQMRRFGPMVSFDLGRRERAERFLGALELVAEATSFGSVHSSAERRARWGQGDAVGEGFIRFSCGCEDTADVLADVERALAART
ncbi:MAG: cystathionine gamma-lyase [Thermoleophilaceae bacterium]